MDLTERDLVLRGRPGHHWTVLLDGADVGALSATPAPGGLALGWWVAPTARGRHVGSRALRLLVAHLHPAEALTALVEPTDQASRWICAAAGLHLVAALPGRGEVWGLQPEQEPRAAQPDLTAGSLHLRPLLPSDAGRIAEACQDPVSRRWLPALPDPYGETEGRAFVASSLGGWAADTDWVWGFCDVTTGDLLGCVGVHARHPFGAWRELGWHCFPWARGHGHTAAAAATVSRFALAQGLTRLDARIHPDNAASQRVAARAGMVLEATLAGAILDAHGPQPAQIWCLPGPGERPPAS